MNASSQSSHDHIWVLSWSQLGPGKTVTEDGLIGHQRHVEPGDVRAAGGGTNRAGLATRPLKKHFVLELGTAH